MNEALPTPYDIVGLPTYAWQPGILAWATLGLLVVGVVAATSLSKRRKSLINAWRIGVDELGSVVSSNDSDITKLSLASSICKRLCGYLEQSDFSGMSPAELERSSSKSEGPLSQILTKLASIDRVRYAASQQVPEASSVVAELRQLLDALWNSKRAKEQK